MNQLFPAATTISSDSVPKEHQGIAASPASLVDTIELHVNGGGTYPCTAIQEPFALQVGLDSMCWIFSWYCYFVDHKKVEATRR